MPFFNAALACNPCLKLDQFASSASNTSNSSHENFYSLVPSTLKYPTSESSLHNHVINQIIVLFSNHEKLYLSPLIELRYSQNINVSNSCLEEIRINDYHITEFPTPLLNYTKLRSINLANNKITEIPNNIHNLKNLEDLNLTGNSITTISVDVKQLPKSCKISLDEEGLSDESKTLLLEIRNQGGPQIYNFSRNFKSHFA